jgi:sec-independent protein translocase protein TatB|tara:strand:+ start:448 stop:747 length:300 start_codon:yes stop_codon:yes gene_type:complete
MLPGVGGVEYLVIAALIIIFVGPKDLPGVLRTFGRWWGKIKNFSKEFKASINDIAAETGIDEIKASVEKNKPKNFTDEMRDSINESIKADEKKDDESEK